MDLALHRFAAMASVLRIAANWRRAELTDIVFDYTHGVVATGPFTGMQVNREQSWSGDDLATKWLGLYEQELHPALEAARRRRYGAIVNVGCAEGYYAIGLARMFPGVAVHAFDDASAAAPVVARNAAANGVGEQVQVGGFCTAASLAELATRHGPLLCVIDCEGFELDLLPDDEPTSRALAGSDLLIECHEGARPGCTAELTRRLEPAHEVTAIRQGPRDPSAFPYLRALPDLERWILMDEGRPSGMGWLWCVARSPGRRDV